MRFLEYFVAGAVFTSTLRALPNEDFDGGANIGHPRFNGSVQFNSATREYTVTGGGSNTWFSGDAFYFSWKKVSGDISLAADIAFQGNGGDPHRKACLIVRQSLEPDSPYADA